jgi:glycosyltransferase involved in cell wall biosynthesis
MNSALVDVVIPNYERTDKLLMAVQSVLIQGKAINKIIIVDDGSSPNVIEFINQNILCLPKVEFIAIPHSGNPGIVRNVGINHTSSEYIAFLDSDDFWFPGKIDLQLSKFKKNIVLVCSNARVYQNNKIVKNYFKKKSRIIKKSNIFLNNYVINSSVLVKSNALKTMGGYTQLNTVIGLEDYVTWTRLINTGNFYFMQDCLLGYTLSKSSISLMVTQKQILASKKIIYSELNHIDRLNYVLIQISKQTKIVLYKIFFKVISKMSSIIRYSGFFQQGFRSLTSSKQVKSFTRTNFKYSNKVRKILKIHNPFYDKYLLERNPKLCFEQKNGRQVVQLDSNYLPDYEIRTDNRPYEALFNSLFSLNEFKQVKSFIDVGCSSGNLLDLVSTNFPAMTCAGIETFAFLKNAAPLSIISKIFLEDLRFPLINKYSKFELTVCLEVAEHIDPNSLDDFIDNLKQLSGRYLVMSWSSSYPPPDAPPQHLAPLRKFQYKKILRKSGFTEDKKLTDRLKKIAKAEPNFHIWWLETITVWIKNDS